MHEVVIRTYNPAGDYPALKANLRQAKLYDPDRDTEERLRRFAKDVLVAETEGKLVGNIYVVEHIVSTFWRLAVDEAYRRRGIGTALLRAAQSRLAQGGAKDMEGFFAVKNSKLRLWYENRGLRDGGEYRSIWIYTNDKV